MFLEPSFRGQRSGWIEVICGSMFSGKTEELIRRLRRARYANQDVIVYKPKQDTRYSQNHVVSHDENDFNAEPVAHSSIILDVPAQVKVVGIDEAQFFDDQLTEHVQRLALRGMRVVVAGLDMDFMGKPFGPMADILSVAEYVTKLHAICPHCGNLATHSYRLVAEDDQFLLGDKGSYEPRCRVCYSMGNILDFRASKKSETS